MRKIYYRIVTILVMGAAPFCVYSQADIHFSQFYETSILRNPALTGVFTDDYKVGVIYRNQWSSISNPFQTALVSGESRFKLKNGNDYFSAGLVAYYDRAGSINQQIAALYPAINYNKLLESQHNSFLSVGFTGGFLQYSYSPDKATFNNQFQNGVFNASNPTGENLPNPNLSLMDLGAGINFNSSTGRDNNVSYVIGVSGYHFSHPSNSWYRNNNIRLDTRWNVNGALSSQLTDNYSLQLFANYAQQGDYREIIAGGLVGWNKPVSGEEPAFTLDLGVFYRVDDAIIPTIKIKYKQVAFGGSYDVNVSSLKAGTNMRGGFEISIFKTGFYHETEKGQTICPNFY